MKNKNAIQTKLKEYGYFLCCIFLTVLPQLAFAESDPMTKTGNKAQLILFGALGISLCTIFIGVAFLSAKIGRCSWDRFVSILLCTAGFLGAPSIVLLIKATVS